MQQTRRHILDILKERGQATVDDIVAELRIRRGDITAVTVRHHLTRLQEDELITDPILRHRETPGRPQHVYALTQKGKEAFPNNYQELATELLRQIHAQFPPEGVNVILQGVADRMASEAQIPDVPLPQRLDLAVNYLNQRGYDAYWETQTDGYVLHTSNCPYPHISEIDDSCCNMDMRLIASLLGVVPRLMARISAGEATCAYMIPTGK